MQVKFLKKDGFDYKFVVQNTRSDILNAMRRTIMLHVPVLGIKEVSVYKNESVMPDEMLAHRIGLVPVYSDDVDDKEYHLYLKKTSGMVYSGDISGSLDIPLKHIPLVQLNKDKSLELELLVQRGTGEEHVKYCPASVFFYNTANVKQNSDVVNIENICPGNCLEKKANKIVMKDPYSCDICRYCETKTNKALELVFNTTEFVFSIEPFGNLDLDVMISYIVDFLNKDLEELKQQLEGKSIEEKVIKIKKNKVEITIEKTEEKPKEEKAKKVKKIKSEETE